MAQIRPFRALRPAAGYEETVTALPYDVYNRTEARQAVRQRPDSFLSIDRPETQFPETYDMYAREVYEKAAEILGEWTDRGTFVREETACYYIWEMTAEGKPQTGLAACISAADYRGGVIRRHERTREEKERDRVCHIEGTRAQTGPVLLAYRSNEELKALISSQKEKTPLYAFTDFTGVSHRMWKISDDETIRKIGEYAEKISSLYIADGHHRASAAVTVAEKYRGRGCGAEDDSQYFLAVMFPQKELKILDYNRIVKDLNGMTEAEALEKIRESFLVGEPQQTPFRPGRKGEIGLYLGGSWFPMRIREEKRGTDPVSSLDVEYLQRELFAPFWNITQPGADPRIEYIGGSKGAEELERRCGIDAAAAFLMYPTSMEELMAAADAGMLMPPKSTWFEPKLRTGLLIHPI